MIRFFLALLLIAALCSGEESTILRLTQGTIKIGAVEYPYRLRVVYDSGPQWKEINGIGSVFITEEDPTFRITVANDLSQGSVMHPHGLTAPIPLDGVSYVTQPPIPPGRMHKYEFAVDAHDQGTYFYHAHYAFQHHDGLSAPLIVKGRAPPNYPDAELIDQATDAIMWLEDFCPLVYEHGPDHNLYCNDSMSVYMALKERWERMEPTFDMEACQEPLEIMDMGFRYHLVNERQLSDPDVLRFKLGETVRLRIIVAGSFMNYRVDFGDLNATVIAADGQWTVPKNLNQTFAIRDTAPNTIWLSPAQRYDIIINSPSKPGVHVIKAVPGGTYHQQTGMLLVFGDVPAPAPGTYSDTHNDSYVWMWQEPEFEAWFPLQDRPVDRELEFNVTGDNGFRGINGYSWTRPPIAPEPAVMNPFPMMVNYGERVCININNFSPWAHPFHFHGHQFAVASVKFGSLGVGNIRNGAIRDTVQSTKGCGTTRICFDATNPGTFLIHCHKDIHAAAGMITSVEYSTNTTANNNYNKFGPIVNTVNAAYPEWGKRKVYTMKDQSQVGGISRDDWNQLMAAASASSSSGQTTIGGVSVGSNAIVGWFFAVVALVAIVFGGVMLFHSRRDTSFKVLGNDDESGQSSSVKSSGRTLLRLIIIVLVLAVVLGISALILATTTRGATTAYSLGLSSSPSSSSSSIVPSSPFSSSTSNLMEIPDHVMQGLNSVARSSIIRSVCPSEPFVATVQTIPTLKSSEMIKVIHESLLSLSVPCLIDAVEAGSDQIGWTSVPSTSMLQAYRQRFGFPFVLESGNAKDIIMSRLTNTPSREISDISAQLALTIHRKLATILPNNPLLNNKIDKDSSSNSNSNTTTTVHPTPMNTSATPLPPPPLLYPLEEITVGTLITTHVLDVERGISGNGVGVTLQQERSPGVWMTIDNALTDAQGRASFDHANPPVVSGTYRLIFETELYFQWFGDEAFFPQVIVPFKVNANQPHYHVPVVIAPYSYQTYRGT